MNLFSALVIIAVLIALPWVLVGAAGLDYLFGVIVPLIALVVFVVGLVLRVLKWARSPVPFRIPTTCGQQKSLGWIKSSKLESPHSMLGVIGRMLLEVLFFRSLFRNTRAELRDGPRLTYAADKWLWAGGLAFHWTFLIILARHMRFFLEPVPWCVTALESLDGFFQIGLPIVFITDVVIVAALTYLFLRRIVNPRLRYISLAGDYFPLLLLLGVALSGVCVRYFDKTDILSVKELAMGLVTFAPVVPDGITVTFFIHLFLVSALLIYFPFSKLVHMVGVFFSPTRNLANNNRMRRHVNPWDYRVKVHTYEEYEDEFREVMRAAEMPLEKE